MTSPTSATTVDFFFDPVCPWAWMTSRWVDEVARHRELDVRWHVMSLYVLNEHEEQSDRMRDALGRSLRYGRVVTAAAELGSGDRVKRLYDALGTRIHPGARKDVDAIIAESLAEAGLPSEWAEYADSDEFDEALRASHADGIRRVGRDVGTPVIDVEGTAFFGPVISPAPTGDEAVRLWDGVVAVAAYDGFFELKRERTREPIFD